MSYCKYCAKRSQTERGDDGYLCCTLCGRVIDSDMFSTETTFVKDQSGRTRATGTNISTARDCSESYARTLDKGRDEIGYLVENLGISGGNSVIDQASAFYKIAVDRNFTRGRRTSLVAAACLYIVCRDLEKAFLLIDFSEELRVNVYVLGGVFLQLCKLLRLEEHPIVQKLVDPSLFIHRFSERLLGGKNSEVSGTALKIIASMKRDWMQTGRKPSGLCGAALYISAHSYGIKCSKSDIVNIVHVCETTLTKRLIEFENTESGSLTIEEFITKANELEKESGSQQLVIKSSGAMELLCEHKGSKTPHFAHGLCKECYGDFVKLSGGLQGGSNPPAFQRAERERMSKESAVEKDKAAEIFEDEVEHSSQPDHDVNANEKHQNTNANLNSGHSESIDGLSGTQALEEGVCGMSNENEGMNNVAGDEAESLSDIDDAEVSGYLHDEEEKRLKTIIWETLNREYLEEEAAKERAAKAAYEAKFKNCSEEFLAAHELAEAAAAAAAKSRKERRQKRASDAKNAAPAKNAAEAARQMLTKRKASSKINYDVLDKLFDDSAALEDTKKRHIESNSKDDANEKTHIKGNRETEADILENSNNYGHGDEYDEEYTGGGMGGDDLYAGHVEEEYGEDYGYEW